MTNIRKGFKLTRTDKDKQIEELEKENADLKEKLNFSTQYYQGEKAKEQLTKAKELIEEFCTYRMYDCDATRKDYEMFEELKEQAEQFLKENGGKK